MIALAICVSLILTVIEEVPEPPLPVPLIYDTDMGNDVDDGFALGVIHALQSRGECELLAVTVTKDHELAGPFVDVLNTFYGRGDVAVGVVRNGAEPKQGKFLGLAAEMKDGAYRFPHDLHSGDDAPEATDLLRKVLASQADYSVVIVQVGFSTNMARLLDTQPDECSPLNGGDLVARKVKVLSVMAGAFEPSNGKPHREYNVAMDVPAAQKLAREWPTPIVYSGFEIGIKTRLPKEAIRHDFNYVPDHPMRAAYHLYNDRYHDQPSWDLTSVLWAVRPDRGYFGLSPRGRVSYDKQGYSTWTEDPSGNHCYLTVDEKQIERVKEILTTLASEPPHLQARQARCEVGAPR
jgi:inosine-uridine nucleoside N-ribohydrolase